MSCTADDRVSPHGIDRLHPPDEAPSSLPSSFTECLSFNFPLAFAFLSHLNDQFKSGTISLLPQVFPSFHQNSLPLRPSAAPRPDTTSHSEAAMAAKASPTQVKGSSLPTTKAKSPHPQEQKAHAFLVLAPTQSASYPLARVTTTSANVIVESNDKSSPTSPSVVTSPLLAPAPKPTTTTSTDGNEFLAADKSSRSSSISSDGARTRFLKLGPVHWGGEPGVGDWAEGN